MRSTSLQSTFLCYHTRRYRPQNSECLYRTSKRESNFSIRLYICKKKNRLRPTVYSTFEEVWQSRFTFSMLDSLRKIVSSPISIVQQRFLPLTRPVHSVYTPDVRHKFSSRLSRCDRTQQTWSRRLSNSTLEQLLVKTSSVHTPVTQVFLGTHRQL